jgi:tryptophan-rich sensory protein
LKAFLFPLVFCAVSLALEGLCAGGDIRHRLAELKTPRFVPPLWGWIVIAVFYYLMCFVMLYRLFQIAPGMALRNTAIVLVSGLMLINAFWNYFFFRSRNLFHAYLIGFPYGIIALILFCLLLRLDRVAALWLSPYLLYLCYASAWGHQIWKLNSPADPRGLRG